MENVQARIVVPINSGHLEISGSEDFVAKHFELLKELIIDTLKQPQKPPQQLLPQSERIRDTHAAINYDKVLSISPEKIQILQNLPGNNNKEKTINAAVLTFGGRNKSALRRFLERKSEAFANHSAALTQLTSHNI